MLNQICSSCNELTGPAARCECCGGDPAAAEVVCHECQGTCRVVRYAGRYRMNTVWVECEACYLSGRPGYVEAPYILEHDRYAKRAYWMDCPLSEIPLRAPFKELREVEPHWWRSSRNIAYRQGFFTCESCGYWGCELEEQGTPPWCQVCSSDINKAQRDWTMEILVPAGLSAGGEA